jgi:anti-sigma factor RsiW
MNGHCTEQQLIDYAFELASQAGMHEIRAHLNSCDACRAKLDELKSKFSSLDLLREEMGASEALIAGAVAAATQSRRPAILRLWARPWLGAVAAVVVVGVALLVVSTFGPGQKASPPAAEELFAREDLRQRSLDAPAAAKPEKFAATGRPLSADAEAWQPQAKLGFDTLAEPSPTPSDLRLPHAEADEKPPFAPASAIELVVLPRRQNVQLTIYNGADLTLVREQRRLTLKKGWNWLQFMWANTLIDPTSLSLEPSEHRDKVEVQQLVFPPRLRELGRWLIRSEVEGQVPFELTYMTSGLSWRAFYMGTLSLDERSMRLEGYVRVDNDSGEDYEDAQTRLLVGEIHLLDEIRDLAQRQYAYDDPRSKGPVGGLGGAMHTRNRDDTYLFFRTMDESRALSEEWLERKEIIKEGLSEYFLYTIEGTETIPNEWGKRLLSFEADDIPVTSLYKYNEERWGTEPIRFVSFANDVEHKLGETPLPNGNVRIYSQIDDDKRLAYVGGTETKYIPVGEKVELDIGPARLVKVEPVLMDVRTENHTFNAKGNVTGWDEVRAWKIEIANARALPVEIEITRGFDTPQWELQLHGQTATYEKYDVNHARFQLTVGPRSKEVLTYTVTTYHGAREQVLIRRQRNAQR